MTTRAHTGSGRRRALAAAAALAVLTAACGDSGESDDANPQQSGDYVPNELEADDPPQDGGQLKVAITAETNGWNPGTSQFADAGNIVGSTVFEPLMAFDENGVAVPYLAESVEPNADFTEWTIVLPEGVTFHDGTQLTPQIVAANINFYAHGPTLSKVANDAIVGTAEAVDATTVKVPLNMPWSAFSATLAGPSGYIMAESMLQEANGYGTDNPVGTGPFQFESWEPDESFRVSKFDDYRVEGEPHLDEIEFLVLVDPGARDTALEAGDVQMIFTNSPAAVRTFRGDPEFTVVEDLDSEKSFIQLNTSKPPFDNKLAREALAYATDRQLLADVVGEGVVTMTDDPLNGDWKVEDAGYVTFDAERAASLVEQYEAETGQPLAFTLSGLNNVADAALVDALSEQWAAVGMEVTGEQNEQTKYINDAVGGAYEAQSFRNFAYADPDSNFVFWHSSTATPPISINFTQFTDPTIDAALDGARTVGTPEERKPYYEDVVRTLNSEFTHIWLFNTPYSLIARTDVRGLNGARTTPFGNFLPKTWWGDVWIEQG